MQSTYMYGRFLRGSIAIAFCPFTHVFPLTCLVSSSLSNLTIFYSALNHYQQWFSLLWYNALTAEFYSFQVGIKWILIEPEAVKLHLLLSLSAAIGRSAHFKNLIQKQTDLYSTGVLCTSANIFTQYHNISICITNSFAQIILHLSHCSFLKHWLFVACGARTVHAEWHLRKLFQKAYTYGQHYK